MGTRADFYIRKQTPEGTTMEWLGSIAWDGYPDGINKFLLHSTSEEEYRDQLCLFFKSQRSVTLPEHGWPWPWEDSSTTDFSYIFENGKVMASNFGYHLFDPLNPPKDGDEGEEDERKMDGYFPNMKHIQNVNFGERSGLLIFSASKK